MATNDFIIQGLTSRSHCVEVKGLLTLKNLNRATISVAFINENGVDLIEDELKGVSEHTTVYGGIRNGITSRQGLERLLALGLNLFVVDTGSPSVIYHPKLYYARSPEQACFISGSANLTIGGLNNNIEASVIMGFDLTDGEDAVFACSIETQIDAIPIEYPENVKRVASSDYLAELMRSGLIIDERATSSKRRSTSSASTSPSGASTPRIALKIPQVGGKASQVTLDEPVVELETEPSAPATGSPGATAPTTVAPPPATGALPATPSPAATGSNPGPLVWCKPNLQNSDAQQPKTQNSAITGNVKLTQARFKQAGGVIDQTTYFRNSLFSHLTWGAAGGNKEKASAIFHIIDRGQDLGSFQLTLSHDSDRISGQGNVPTWLHWGDAMNVIKAANILGTTLSLYGPDSSGTFTIEFS